MKWLLFVPLILAGCAQLTGDPEKDCLEATNVLNAATSAAEAAALVAQYNPQSERMQRLAELAEAAAALALRQQALVCS